MTEPLDLEPIKARLSAATPTPWHENPWNGSSWSISGRGSTGYDHSDWVLYVYDDPPSKGDAALIANAPTDISALIAEVERLRDENDKLVELYGKQREWTKFAADLGPFPASKPPKPPASPSR